MVWSVVDVNVTVLVPADQEAEVDGLVHAPEIVCPVDEPHWMKSLALVIVTVFTVKAPDEKITPVPEPRNPINKMAFNDSMVELESVSADEPENVNVPRPVTTLP